MRKAGNAVTLAVKKHDASLTNTGALSVFSGEYTGRCPSAKKIVEDDSTRSTVDWSQNQKMSQLEWEELLSRTETYIKAWKEYDKDFYSVKAHAGRPTKWVNRTRKTFKFLCESSVQVQFINNMFDGSDVHDDCPVECEVYCLPSMSKDPIVAINFSEKKIIITGTGYLGEIKKSVFTYMNYVLTDSGILPMHCSVNVDSNHKNPAIFFGLSGTGKTTLSSSSDRVLLGDDEHGWYPGVIFNIESGCYAKTIGLSMETEPEIYVAANKFGSIFENVVIKNGSPDFNDDSITKNGRVSYPLSSFDNYVKPGFVLKDPKNIIMLTCDAFGVLPPVSKLTSEKAREMFLVGYTSKIAGTEAGITEPQAVFSPCFGAPFLPRSPKVYANLLQAYVRDKDIKCWLVNTGWVGGKYGTGKRMNLQSTRDIVKSILSGEIEQSRFYTHEFTDLIVPTSIPNCPEINTFPEKSWQSQSAYKLAATELMQKIAEKARES